jgi:hypothetical protein
VTDPAASPQPQPSEPRTMGRTFMGANFKPPGAPDTWTADATWPAESPIPYTLTPKAETALFQYSSPTPPCGTRKLVVCEPAHRKPSPAPAASPSPTSPRSPCRRVTAGSTGSTSA